MYDPTIDAMNPDPQALTNTPGDSASVPASIDPTAMFKGFGWGDALRAMSNIAQVSAAMRRPQGPGVGGVQGLGRAGQTTSPFGAVPARPGIRPPGGIGSALMGR